MAFQPAVNQQLAIDHRPYTVAEHPFARGIPYGQEGRQATVYQLVAREQGSPEEKRALKVFKPRFQVPSLVSLARRLAPYSQFPGLRVCQRIVLTPQLNGPLLQQFPDLTYSVVMPWIEGPTWMETMLRSREFSPDQGLALAAALAETLVHMEQEGLAHCDLSGSNILLPLLASATSGIEPSESHNFAEARSGMHSSELELVDVEGMYGDNLPRPETIIGGSYGYAHRALHLTQGGLWQPEADRFAGALLLSEMLGWCDARVRQAAWGESYFDPQEMGQPDSQRFTLLATVLREKWGEQIASLLEQTWMSDSLEACPTFGLWMVALPTSGPAGFLAPTDPGLPAATPPFEAAAAPLAWAGQGYDPEHTPTSTAESHQDPDTRARVRGLISEAQEAEGRGDLAGALQYYREAYSLESQSAPPSGLAKELALIVGNLQALMEGEHVSPSWQPRPQGDVSTSSPMPQTSPASPSSSVASPSVPNPAFPTSPAPSPGSGGPTAVGPVPPLVPAAANTAEPRAAQGSNTDALFDQGFTAYSRQQWLQARDILGEVVRREPSYTRNGTQAMLLLREVERRLSPSTFVPPVPTVQQKRRPRLAILWAIVGVLLVVFVLLGVFLLSLIRNPLFAFGPTSSPSATRVAAGSPGVVAGLTAAPSAGVPTSLPATSGTPGMTGMAGATGTAGMSGGMDTGMSSGSPTVMVTGTPGMAGMGTSGGMTGGSGSPTASTMGTGTGEPVGPISPANAGQLAVLDDLAGHAGEVTGVAFSPDGTRIASASQDWTVRLWQVQDGSLITTLKGHTDGVKSLAFSPDGKLIATGSADKTVRLWRAQDGMPLQTLSGHTGAVNSVAFSPDGRTLASASDDSTVRLWKASDGTLLRTLQGHTAPVYGVAFSPDGKSLASASGDKTVAIWHVADGKVVRSLTGHTDRALSVAFSPDGQMLASSSADRTVRLWRVQDGSAVRTLENAMNMNMGQDMETHANSTTSVAFSPDGQVLMSGLAGHMGVAGHELNAQLWRVSDGTLLRTLEGSSYLVSGVAFSPDGRSVALGTGEGEVIVWALASPAAQASATARAAQHAGAGSGMGAGMGSGDTAQAVPDRGAGSRTFPETGKTVRGLFLKYWNEHGGLTVQGYPISNEIVEISDLDGKPYTVQYFERSVFEYHPENSDTPYEVLLSQLGTAEYKRKYPNSAQGQTANQSNGQFFPDTGHWVGGKFLQFWKEHGGVAQLGFPLSNEFAEKSDVNGKTYTVQYFERAVLELHPENKAPYDVLLSQLGTLQFKSKYPNK